MMKPLFFMGYTPAPDPMRISLFLVWRGQITPTRAQPYFIGANPPPPTLCVVVSGWFCPVLAGSVQIRERKVAGQTVTRQKNRTYPDTVTP